MTVPDLEVTDVMIMDALASYRNHTHDDWTIDHMILQHLWCYGCTCRSRSNLRFLRPSVGLVVTAFWLEALSTHSRNASSWCSPYKLCRLIPTPTGSVLCLPPRSFPQVFPPLRLSYVLAIGTQSILSGRTAGNAPRVAITELHMQDFRTSTSLMPVAQFSGHSQLTLTIWALLFGSTRLGCHGLSWNWAWRVQWLVSDVYWLTSNTWDWAFERVRFITRRSCLDHLNFKSENDNNLFHASIVVLGRNMEEYTEAWHFHPSLERGDKLTYILLAENHSVSTRKNRRAELLSFTLPASSAKLKSIAVFSSKFLSNNVVDSSTA